MKALIKIYLWTSLSTIPFVYHELLKKNHNFQELQFFWKNSSLPPEKVQKNMKAGL